MAFDRCSKFCCVGVRRFLMVFAFNPTQPNMLLAAGRRLISSVQQRFMMRFTQSIVFICVFPI